MQLNGKEITKVHFVGIGGIGMSALAQLMLDHGVRVSGSDRDSSPVTELLESKGITVKISQDAANVPEDIELLVYSDAVPQGDLERQWAVDNSVEQMSYFEAVGLAAQGKRTIAIAGTHGKTTTTGRLARILKDAGASPTGIVGSLVKDFGSNYLPGTSDIFVVEACEYKRHFLNFTPDVLVVTNLEFDHTDYFRDLTDVQDAFRTLMERVPEHGAIVTDTTHPNIASLLLGVSARVIDYTQEPSYALRLPGEFNIMNARAAASAARVVLPGLSAETLLASLADFHGTWRRFEYKGKTATGADVYDDYAHHPTAIAATLTELRKRAKGKVFVAFHPHLYSRTRDLFDGFAGAFKEADHVLLAPIYAARETDDGSMSSILLADRIVANGTEATALDSFEAIEESLAAAGPDDIIVTMGAGDIYKVADALVSTV
jgi:UDP-N-acetylmuramate--alanine ligase